jgi:hypothetical protein
METMTTETLPLLAYMLSGNSTRVSDKQMNSYSKKSDAIVKQNLTQSTINYIYDISQGDLLLRDNTARDYPLNMWTNLPEVEAMAAERNV